MQICILPDGHSEDWFAGTDLRKFMQVWAVK